MKKMRLKYGSIAAAILCASLILSGCGQDSGTIVQNDDGSYTAEENADAAVVEQGISYTIKLEVTTDADGTILSVKDNGTEVPDGKDGAYKKAQELFKELVGKNEDTISDVDAISGATVSSEAILAAARQALKDIEEEE